MNFSYKFKTLRSRNSYDSRTQPEMSAHEDETRGEVNPGIIEGNDKKKMRFSPDLID